MRTKDFLKTSKGIIHDYIVENSDENEELPEFRIYTVWSSKTLQNNKALLSTTLSDDMYYESTYDGDNEEIYLDAYKKVKSISRKV
ncbi:DUF6275 family protein [Tetragenococcus muriaticus]|uniref:Phage protein n=2 Tax=Tetragenococcus muriaticus TaxID=64642 RepID=A0A091BTS1_9ENTE|nr:DUF6275 family protein [Tetragenococcus muriaticus]KFN89056.1 hypothetical protein TMU3MR103_2253 [Tetragenococcus muriaticus 3MR10-3]KFN92392.1 hypothetical protein TMUPMC115_0975 [Tetragenococcus muriaticus PMC-11-5]GMA46541.1 hypothetical protein GCM10025854_07910 [Tetragenococcus muriaticus]